MIIDSDTHINEPMEVFEQYLKEAYRSRRPRIVSARRSYGSLALSALSVKTFGAANGG